MTNRDALRDGGQMQFRNLASVGWGAYYEGFVDRDGVIWERHSPNGEWRKVEKAAK